MSPHSANPLKDAADDRRRLLITAGLVLAVFSIGAATQTAFVYEIPVPGDGRDVTVTGFLLRTIVNLASCAGALGLAVWLRLPALSPLRLAVTGLSIALVIGLVRFAVQILTGIYSDPALKIALVELVSGSVVVLVALAFGMMHVRSQARLRSQERSLAEQRLRASEALAALAEEELEVRRAVAEGLHGGLQSRLVMLRVQLDHVIANWIDAHSDREQLDVLRRVRGELDALREDEVRKFSHLLYPEGVDISLSHALAQLVRRIPPQIAVDMQIDDVGEQEEDVDRANSEGLVAWRVALLRAAEEAISNALRHGGAARIRVTLRRVDERVELAVDDNGGGMPEPPSRMRGLARSAERLSRLGGAQRVSVSALGGVRLAVTMPVMTTHGSDVGTRMPEGALGSPDRR